MIKVLGIEGMGDTGALWSYLGRPMTLKYPGKIEYFHSTWQDWQKYINHEFDVIAGHSLGGDSAIRLCKTKTAYKMAEPKLLMTLAARHQSVASWFDFLFPLGLQSFTAPNSVTHNFYTVGLLSSQAIKGAVENVNVTSLSIWHGNVPAAPAVHACLSKFIEQTPKG